MAQREMKLFSIPELSQNTNNYITQISSGQVFISSIDGLNIFDGRNVKYYKPATHNMLGSNIQSDFFEDEFKNVWFCTYNALHQYIYRQDDFDVYAMTDIRGDTLNSDYRILGRLKNELIVRADKYLFLFNILRKEITRRIEFDQIGFHYFVVINNSNGFDLISSNENVTTWLKFDEYLNIIQERKMDINATGLYSESQGAVWIGTKDGYVLKYDLNNSKEICRQKIAGSKIFGFCRNSNKELFVSTASDGLIEIDANNCLIIDHTIPLSIKGNTNLNILYRPYFGVDSTFWIGSEGEGVFFKNFPKDKFSIWPIGVNLNSYPNVSGVFKFPLENKFLIATRADGIIILDEKGNSNEAMHPLFNGNKQFKVESGTFVNEREFLFSCNSKLYLYTLESNVIVELKNTSDLHPDYFMDLTRLSNGKIITSIYKNQLIEVIIVNHSYTLVQYPLLKDNEKILTTFKIDAKGRMYISVNEEQIAILEYNLKSKNYEHLVNLKIPRGVTSILEHNEMIYLANRDGLFTIDTENFRYERIIDNQNKLLQTIYGIFSDNNKNLWLSTNNGIIKYNPKTNDSDQFSVADGVQALEFNSNASLQLDDGTIMFGGVKGLNVFHPDSIKLSTKPAIPYLSNYKINDEDDFQWGQPAVLENLNLNYEQNTVSFQFHGIDYSDPKAVRVKYKMEGVDEKYVPSDNPAALARYANLDPGAYTFNIHTANSDGYWTTSPKTIEINILPPYWQTWWFRTLSIIGVIGFTYAGFKYYYKQKLNKKELEIREMNLIISKQEALQEERTRIAGEMHDELGGGLTSIKFLSQAILRKITDDKEKGSVQKIVNHAETLVANMSEIIWAMNSGFDTLESLIAYTRRNAFDFLEDYNFTFNFEVIGDTKGYKLSGEKRRNIYLIIKEALHNAVKHSGGDNIEIKFYVREYLEVLIVDNGIGIKELEKKLPLLKRDEKKLSGAKVLGNGIRNMTQRVKSFQGTFSMKGDVGVEIRLKVPLVPQNQIAG